MNYQQTLEYLYHKLPMFSRVGTAALKPDLTNTIALCNAIGNPQQHFKIIHVAGTNGKGSTSHMLAAILQQAGYKTGLYTSPHLKHFTERIKVNGKMIKEEAVVNFTNKIKPQIDIVAPSFFEITVAMAFDYFASEQVQVAVIETGLGGRLDSTNIVQPVLSIITNIGWDHMNILGNTLEKIAFEKAGIIKPGVPVIIGEAIAESKPVFDETAYQKKSPIVYAPEKRRVIEWQYAHHYLKATVIKLHTDEVNFYELDLPGLYQLKNIITVLEAVSALQQQGFTINHQHVVSALKHVKKLTGLHGRWELVHEHPSVIIDVAHNEDGIKQIIQQLEITSFNNLHIVLGMVKDKDIENVLALLPANATYYFTQAQIPRALPAIELQQKATAYQLLGKVYITVNDAVKTAVANAHKQDLILVCGSVFVAGEVNI
jgi:dihydrofolate synthase / folylpolyglutamate synthase